MYEFKFLVHSKSSYKEINEYGYNNHDIDRLNI